VTLPPAEHAALEGVDPNGAFAADINPV